MKWKRRNGRLDSRGWNREVTVSATGWEEKDDEKMSQSGASVSPEHTGWPCPFWGQPGLFGWIALGWLSGQRHGLWGLNQVWDLAPPLPAWIHLNQIPNLSLSPFPWLSNGDSNAYFIRPLQGAKVNKIMHIVRDRNVRWLGAINNLTIPGTQSKVLTLCWLKRWT